MIYLYENQFSYTDNPLPEEWKEHLPKADHMWIYKTPFTQSVYNDYTDLDMSHVNKLRWYPPQPSLRVISIPLSTVSLLGISYFGCQGKYGTWSCTLNVMIVASILLPVQACTHMLDRCWMGGKCPRMWVTGSSFYHYYQQLRLGHESGEIAEMAWFWN